MNGLDALRTNSHLSEQDKEKVAALSTAKGFSALTPFLHRLKTYHLNANSLTLASLLTRVLLWDVADKIKASNGKNLLQIFEEAVKATWIARQLEETLFIKQAEELWLPLITWGKRGFDERVFKRGMTALVAPEGAIGNDFTLTEEVAEDGVKDSVASHRFPFSSSSSKNQRETMEDRNVEKSLDLRFRDGIHQGTLLAVFDGHGGDKVVQWASQNLEGYIRNALNSIPFETKCVSNVLKDVIVNMHNDLKRSDLFHLKANFNGTTIVFGLIIEEHLWVVKLGDSRGMAVVFDETERGHPLRLTRDDHPSDLLCSKKLKKRGWRHFEGEVATGLTLGGGIGSVRSRHLIRNPKVYHHPLSRFPQGAYLVFSSDGLEMTVDQIADSVDAMHQRQFSLQRMSRSLVKSCLSRTKDNITVTLLRIPPQTNERGRKGGIIAFHDICPHPDIPECQVDEFWNDIKGKYHSEEIIGTSDTFERLGIGVIRV